MPTVDLSERDNKETLFVKEEVTDDAEVFGEVKVDVEGSQKEPFPFLFGFYMFYFWNFLFGIGFPISFRFFCSFD